MVGKERNAHFFVILLVANVPGCSGSNAKTLGLKTLQFPDMQASSLPQDEARAVHHRTKELLVKQNTIPDGDNFSCFGELPALPVSVLLSISRDRYASTR